MLFTWFFNPNSNEGAVYQGKGSSLMQSMVPSRMDLDLQCNWRVSQQVISKYAFNIPMLLGTSSINGTVSLFDHFRYSISNSASM